MVGDQAQVQRRQDELLRWTVKVLGADLVQRHYAQGLAGPAIPLPPEPIPLGLTSRSCRQADIESDWLRHWCLALGTTPFYHRKLWEDCFILQALWEAGMMAPGRRAIGFAVGKEPLPAILASHGVSVLATDIDATDSRARDWIETGQHVANTDALYRPHLQDRAGFDAMVSFRPADMAELPEALLDGSFDMLWSACAMEHLGSIERGLTFVQRAMRCLKPGGIAVHTTELNLDATGETLTGGSTVLYQRRNLEALSARLAADGHAMLPLALEHPPQVFDQFIDMPPYEEERVPLGFLSPPHLRLSIAGYVSTSVGIIIRKAG
jgi:SAM-dependent methyltransferase